MKRVLFISYYFPPSGGPGVQRALKFVKYLPAFGWQPTVLTVDPKLAAYPSLDESLLQEIPDDIDVVRTRSWDPYASYARLLGKAKQDAVGVSFGGESRPGPVEKAGRWIRANIFIPDARLGWVPFAVRAGRHLLEHAAFDAIVTTGPPHSTHLIARKLRGLARRPLPWLADFRDPWTRIDYYHDLPNTRLALAADRRMERRVITEATRVTTVTPSIIRSFASDVDRRYDLVMNGFDPADFHEAASPDIHDFVIRHVGNMPAARNPDALWKALAMDDTREEADPRVELIGSVDPAVLDAARHRGVDFRVEVRGYVSHAAAVRLMKSSDILLLVINDVPGAEGIMTGKLFEYIASGRPILSIGPPGGDAAAAIRQVSAGEVFDYDDAEGVRRFLESYVTLKRDGNPMNGATWEAAQAYSRVSQTEKLAETLNGMVVSGRPDSPDGRDRS